MTYRKLGKYLEAQEHAAEAVSAAQELDGKGVPLTQGLTDAVADARWPLWVVLALAHMQVAGCHSDRDGKLDEAARSLKEAERVFQRMDDHAEINARETETYADLETERGRLLLAEDRATTRSRLCGPRRISIPTRPTCTCSSREPTRELPNS